MIRPSLEAVFRLGNEPYRYYTETDVHAALSADPAGYFQHLDTLLSRLADGRAALEMPAKSIFSDPGEGGDFRLMPCIVRDGERVIKSVKLIGTNTRQKKVPGQITVGKSFLIDADENYITHVFEACLLSSARTAMCACLALSRLGAGRRLTLVGAGRVGYYIGFYMLGLGMTDELVVSDINTGQARNLRSTLHEDYPDIPISVAPYAQLEDTDVLVLATTSSQVVYQPAEFACPLIVSLGADIDYQHELSVSLATDSRIYVDTPDSMRYGDLKLWCEQGLIRPEQLTHLLSMYRQPPVADKGRRIFISTGTALFDNLTMDYLTVCN